MSRIVFLGTASAVSFPDHENSHLLFEGQEETLLVDCVGNPLNRLEKVGIDINQITRIVITHFHPDHVSGLPLLLMNMWLLGREKRLDLYGLAHSLDRVKKMMALFDWSDWSGMYPVAFHPLPEEAMAPVMDNEDFRVHSTPVDHLVPTIGLRVEFRRENFRVAYSSDTGPCPQMIQLAEGVDVLIHEAGGDYRGHTTAAQAGEIAQKAGADLLYLIHYSLHEKTAAEHLAEAKKTFAGRVMMAEDFLTIEI